MKKTLVAITMAIALQATTSFAAALPSNLTGDLYAIKDTNIRSSARITRNIIGHIDANQSVKVVSKLGAWCKISGTKYKNAYVVCNLLAKKTTPAATVAAPASQNITSDKSEQSVTPVQVSQSQNIITFVSPNETQENKTNTQQVTQETSVRPTQETQTSTQQTTQETTQQTQISTQQTTQETQISTQQVTQEVSSQQTQVVTQQTTQETTTQQTTQEIQVITQQVETVAQTQSTEKPEVLDLKDTTKNITNTIKLDLQYLTQNDNEGRKIINNAVSFGQNSAKFWRKDATLGEAKIIFPARNFVHYFFYFVSDKDKEQYYKTINSPLDQTRSINYATVKTEVPVKLNKIEAPVVNYANALQKILDDKKLINSLDDKFKYSKQSDIFIEFTLTGDKTSSSWFGRFNDYNKEIESYVEIDAINQEAPITVLP